MDDTTADIRKPGRRAQKKKQITLARRFTPRFWEDADSRIAVVRLIRKRYELLRSHCGGEESAQRDLLVRRTAFLSVILESQEVEAAEGGGLDLGSYVQGLNALNGLLRALGLERRMKQAGGLQAYLNGKARA